MSKSDDLCDNCGRRDTVASGELFYDTMTYQGPKWVCSDCYNSHFEVEEEAINSGMSEEEFREYD